MSSFVKEFLDLPSGFDDIIVTINEIWYKYDVDRSGSLNRKETLRFINNFLAQKGKRLATYI
jgi:hypothetical protein